MKILLTGATGLLGNNVLEQLLLCGHEVTALVRDSKRVVVDLSPYVGHYNIKVGNITNIDDLRHAASGCDAIVNCAGLTDMTLRHLKDYYPVNRNLCCSLLQIAQEKKVSVLVHVSTADTIGYGSKEHVSDENDAMCYPFTRSYYALSKKEGEDCLIESSKGVDEFPHRVVILNPGYIIGKHDVRPSSGKMLLMAWRRKVMLAPDGGKSFVSAETVSKAVLAALQKGCNGERYIITDESLSFKELFLLQAAIGGYRQRVILLPHWICRFAGFVGDLLSSIGMNVEFTTRNVSQLLIEEHYGNRKMTEELGIEPKPIKIAVREFLEDRRLLRHPMA